MAGQVQTYAVDAELRSFAPGLGLEAWEFIADESDADQLRIRTNVLVKSTEDIERRLQIPRDNPETLPGYGDNRLRMACLYQAGYIIEIREMDELRERIRAVTAGSFSDSVVSTNPPMTNRLLHPLAESLIRQYQAATTGRRNVGAFEFQRG